MLLPGAVFVYSWDSHSLLSLVLFHLPVNLLMIGFLPEIDAFCSSLSAAAFPLLVDGGLLAVMSAYVIVYSYIEVNSHDDCARELRKTYGAILELPLKPAMKIDETWPEWIARQASNQFVAFLSSSRLVIAWGEDWPQGVLGVLLVVRYSSGGSVGFAGLSAIISISKGLLIPFCQQIILDQRMAVVQKSLDAFMDSQELQDLFADLKKSSVLGPEAVLSLLPDSLKQPSQDILTRFNTSEADLFEPVRQFREDWLTNLRDPENSERIRCCLVGSYLKQGLPCKVLYNSGHMIGKCQLAGFTAAQCKEIGGFTAKQCKDAGFSAQQCKDAGFSAEECKDAGFSCGDCYAAGFSAKQCKDAAFTAEECRTAGFSARDCYDAGFPLAEAGFSAWDLQKAGGTAEVFKDLGFSAQGLRESGFTAEEFLMAGFQIKDCEVVGSADKCFEAMNEMRQRDGRSAQFWIDRGYTAEECRKGGYTKEQIEKASFD